MSQPEIQKIARYTKKHRMAKSDNGDCACSSWIEKSKTGDYVSYSDHLAAREKDLKAIRKAFDDEPELPGEMPDEMWSLIKNDRNAAQELMRIAVRQTKKGIIERIEKALEDTNEYAE